MSAPSNNAICLDLIFKSYITEKKNSYNFLISYSESKAVEIKVAFGARTQKTKGKNVIVMDMYGTFKNL